MNEKGNFYFPEDMNYEDVFEPYKEAFKGPPWYEVTKCAASDELLDKCESGFSRLAIGELCDRCGECPFRPAYENDELKTKFEAVAENFNAQWYMEMNGSEVAMAALVWAASLEEIADERYKDLPEMKEWMKDTFDENTKRIMWLDEIFANKSVRETGNLKNFEYMVNGFMARFGIDTMAFRTINERLIASAQKLGDRTTVLRSGEDVPDRRSFVIITRLEDEEE